jgi:hypothetical protein
MALDPNVIPPPPVIDPAKITSSENLVLGLLGALSPPNPPPNALYSGFPPKHDVVGLNPLKPTSYHYIDFIPEELSLPTGFAYAVRTGTMTGAGQLNTDVTVSGGANVPTAETVGGDSSIPEFMDRIPEYMPIIYLRANVGVPAGAGYTGIASLTITPANPAQYDVTQLSFYGFNKVSSVDYPIPTLPAPGATGPDAPWVAYFNNPNLSGQPRGKDGFILISAGADRLYGTKDDIIVTP